MKYECPICRKQYESIEDWRKCIAECADKKTVAEKERLEKEAIKKANQEKVEREKAQKIGSLKEKIKNTYSELRQLVNEYNELNEKFQYSCNLKHSSKSEFKRFSDIYKLGIKDEEYEELEKIIKKLFE